MTWLIWVLVLFSAVPLTIFDAPVPDGVVATQPSEGNALRQVVLLSLLGIGLGISLSKSRDALKVLRATNLYLLLFFGLITLSVVWSIEPQVTLKRILTAVTIALDGIALAVSSAHYTDFQRVLRPIVTFLLAGSVLFVVVAPEMAIMQSTQPELVGAWHGLLSQKNGLGSLAGIGVVFWLHAYLSKEAPPWMSALGVVVSALCLLHSRSSTSIMATLFSAVLLFMLLRSPPGLRRYVPYFIAVFVGVLLVYSLAVLNLVPGSELLLSPITSLTGKDLTFSGRTAIWAILNEHIALRPWFGSGYGAYWVEIPGSPSMDMLRRLYFYPTEGHNGYLDVINDLGIVGCLILVGYLVVFLRQGLRIFVGVRTQGALYLTLFFEQMLGNLSESRWFNTLGFDFVIMTIATITMAGTLRALLSGPAPVGEAPTRAAQVAPARRQPPGGRRPFRRN